MSDSLAVGSAVAPPRAAALDRLAPPDQRRKLQLALAALWLLDGVLQFQPFMFGRGFPQMLAASAPGNPALLASPISWSAALITHHLVVLNAVFATVQVALGLGIALRPTLKITLAASVAWSLSVWWLGEGFGGLLAGTATPLTGAPGAVLLYALLAVLLWPADRPPAARAPADHAFADGASAARPPAARAPADHAFADGASAARPPAARAPADHASAVRPPTAPYVAARAVGPRIARASWLTIWAGLAALAVLPASRTPAATIAAMAPGQPAWLAWIDTHAATVLLHHGPQAAIVLAAAFALVALAPCLPALAARPLIVLALALSAVLWLAQGLGGILTGSATDPNTAPLLALLALAFWPAPSVPQVAPFMITGSFGQIASVSARDHETAAAASAPTGA
jgi:hypothetical protein